jgi:hypothetical protein
MPRLFVPKLEDFETLGTRPVQGDIRNSQDDVRNGQGDVRNGQGDVRNGQGRQGDISLG